jgi:outer membrane protein assembly factor BamB
MLDAETGKFIWKGEMGGRTLSTPIVVGGKIYVGSSTGAFKCFG